MSLFSCRGLGLFAFAWLFTTPLGYAQNLYGSLTGNVADASTAAVSAARVEAADLTTGIKRQTLTNDHGVYSFNDLPSGSYSVTIQSVAFATYRRDGIPVEAGLVRRLDAVLQLAVVSETLTVDAAAVTLQADRADVNAQISRHEIADLPIDGGRNYQSLYKLLPGFSPPEELLNDAGNPQRAMGTNANGVSYSSNTTRIDGATVADPWHPHLTAYVPPAEAIQTVNVVTGALDAEQGMAGGAAMNVTINSGSNTFHGSAWEYHTNSALRARNYFYCLYTCAGDPNRPAKNLQNQPGATFGGPIRRDRLFFFADWEMTTRRLNASGLRTVPPDDLKRGDFNSYGATIYDSQTGEPGGRNRTPFPNRQIPANRIDPAAAIMASLLPAPTLAGVSNNYFASGGYTFDRQNSDIKVNYNPSAKATVFARYSLSPSEIYDPPTFGKAGGDALNGGIPGDAQALVQNVSLGGTYTLTPRLLADANLGFTHVHSSAQGDDINQNFGLDVLKIPGTNGSNRLQGGIPRFTIMNFSNFGNPSPTSPFEFHDRQLSGVVNLRWMKGAHSIRLGFEYTDYAINHFQPQIRYGPRGGFNFTGGNTSLAGGPPPNTYNDWADFLLGLPADMGKDVQFVNPSSVRMPSYGLYIRDQWQVSRRVTINFGTRYEYYPFATRADRGGERYDPATDKVLIGGVNGVPTSTGVDVGLGQLAPRFGIAWRATDKTVLRGGYGISIDPNSFRYLRDAYPAVISLQIMGPGALQAAGSLRTGLPEIVGPDLSTGVVALPKDVGDTTFPQLYRRGYIQSFNLTLEREMPWGLLGQVGYVGTRAIRQTAQVNINASDSVGTGQAGRLLFIKYGRTADIRMMMPFNTSTYDSLQARLTRRLGSGSMGAAFTFSKSIDYADNSDSPLAWNGPSMWGRNRAQSGFNRPKNLQVYFVEPLPLGHGHRWLGAGLLASLGSGWQVNGIFSAMQGKPFTITTAATSVNSVGNMQTADQVKPVVEFYGDIGRGEAYFDPDAFIPVTAARFGTSGRDILSGPGVVNLDGSLFRNFRLGEKLNLQFRWMVFNVTNTPAFGPPGSTASSAIRNPDGTLKSTGGFTEVTSALPTERHMTFALKFFF